MIIEALIAYIQEKGYRVSVMTESLLIWKIANGQRFNRNWAISKAEISQVADEQILFMEADLQMIAIKKAIEQSARRATAMNMTETYRRRIRIEGGKDETSGRRLHVYDVETGEVITNIMSISIFLNAREESIADVVYCEIDENGKYRQIAGNPIAETKRLVNPEIAVTAFEESKKAEHSSDEEE